MSTKSILAVTDLSARENMAVHRAAQLAGTHRATIKLMYVPAPGQAAHPAAASRLANAASELEDSLGLRVRTAAVKAHTLEHLTTEARGVDLVVLPHRHERTTAAFFRGQPVLRLLRRCGCPVLVARQVRGEHYKRILVAVGLSGPSEDLVKLAGNFDPRAEVEIVHAIGTLDESILRQQEHSGADLVVVGKKRSSAWEDFFHGSVAHRVLSWGASDVLVVPDAYLEATAPLAARRTRRAGKPGLAMRTASRRAS